MYNRLFSISTSYSRLKSFEEARKMRSLSIQIEALRQKNKSLHEEVREEKKQNVNYKKSLAYQKHQILKDLMKDIEKDIIPFNNCAPASDTEEPKAVLLLVQNLFKSVDKNLNAVKIKTLLQHRNNKRYYLNLAHALSYFVAGTVFGATPSFISIYLQAYGYVNAYQLYREGFDNYVSESLKIVMELIKILSLLEQELKPLIPGSTNNQTHYEILKLLPNATENEIKKQYYNLAKVFHPDRGGDAAEFIKISLAKEVLLDPVQRKLYDASIEANRRQYGFR